MTSETFPLTAAKTVLRNLREPQLIELAVQRGEGRLASTGALTMTTGIHTGRSPTDKFTVRDASTEDQIWWDNTSSLAPASRHAWAQTNCSCRSRAGR